MTVNQAAQEIHAAMSDLLPAIKAKGYDKPYLKLDFDVGPTWNFWLSMSTHVEMTALSARVEHLYGTDLDDILSRAALWVEALPMDGTEAMTRAMAPWFELEQRATT